MATTELDPQGVLMIRCWRAMIRATTDVRHLVRGGFQEHGLRGAQFAVMRVLGEAGPEGMKLTDIGDSLSVSCAHVTGLVDHLEEAGYAAREAHPTDRRALLAKLTPRGQAVLDQILPLFVERLRLVFGCLSTEEQQTLANLLTRLQVHVSEIGDELE